MSWTAESARIVQMSDKIDLTQNSWLRFPNSDCPKLLECPYLHLSRGSRATISMLKTFLSRVSQPTRDSTPSCLGREAASIARPEHQGREMNQGLYQN